MKDPILTDLPFPIETPRLILRPVMPGDGAATHEAKKETWDDLTPWMPWTKDGLGDVASNEAVARRMYARFILREDIAIVGLEKATALAVVWAGLHRFDWTARRFEVGYWVRKSAHGKGYATEAANALTRYAFGALNANSVVINHADGNRASKRVIEKLGFTLEGVFRRHHVRPDNGVLTDLYCYARTDLNGLPDLDVKWGPP